MSDESRDESRAVRLERRMSRILGWIVCALVAGTTTPGPTLVKLAGGVLIGTLLHRLVLWVRAGRSDGTGWAHAARQWMLWDRAHLGRAAGGAVALLCVLGVYAGVGVLLQLRSAQQAAAAVQAEANARASASPSPSTGGAGGPELDAWLTPAPSPTSTSTTAPAPTTGPGKSVAPGDGSSPPASTTTALPPAGQAATGAATKTAAEFITLWARPTVPATRWVGALGPVSTPDLARTLTTVDPRNIRSTRVTGAAKAVGVTPDPANPTQVEVTVPTDGGAVTVITVRAGSGWRVASVGPATTDAD